jgi:hypothetical protein
MFVSSFVNGCGCLLANPLDINKGAFVISTGKYYYFNQKVSVEIFQKTLCNTNDMEGKFEGKDLTDLLLPQNYGLMCVEDIVEFYDGKMG